MSRVAVIVFGVFVVAGCVQQAPIARELDASAREDGGSSSDAASAQDGASSADAAPGADVSLDAGAGSDATSTGWAQIINDGVQAVGSAVTTDAQGNVYVAGRVDGDTDFGGGVRQTTAASTWRATRPTGAIAGTPCSASPLSSSSRTWS